MISSKASLLVTLVSLLAPFEAFYLLLATLLAAAAFSASFLPCL